MRGVWIAAVLLSTSACSAPRGFARHRSTVLAQPATALTPEGRPTVVPDAGREEDEEAREPGSVGDSIARLSGTLVGKRAVEVSGRRFPDDCTGLVRAVYWSHGIDLFSGTGRTGDNGVTSIFRYATRHGRIHYDRPLPGDMVFFRQTYDRNRDGRANDGLTHIGVVEGVEPNGTVLVVHRVARGVVRYRMNLDRPHERADASTGRILNDFLKERGASRLAGELFAGYATVAGSAAPPPLSAQR